MTVPIHLSGCAKSFAAHRVLDPVDLEIRAGETLVLLGPSGCGKTTLLRLIAGLEHPDPGGRVVFGKRDVTALPVERRNVGMVFQSYALFPNMTVAGNVGYGLKIRKLPAREREARVWEMLTLMRIGELANRPVSALSGGQRQRVALARAIAVAPDVLLLDEPLTALDAKLRDALRVEIDTLLRSLGITTVYVTHDQAEAMALADRLVVMDRGRIAQVGTPREIWFHPADRFVAGFIGATTALAGQVAQGRLSVAGLDLPWEGPDGAVQVMLRPHATRLTSGPDGVVATVRAAQFLGDRTRLTLALSDATLLSVDADATQAAAPGGRVRLTFDPAALIVLPGGE
ncbi:Spermidine/putrescine import ATP-binding protein PotA [Rhodovastum atsumiense]|uniref:ABC transporter ATP-binding protein n=1 Tax=Rhodovastum atsumiense TaxID=504468 RepID=A0A5M6ISE4_9PROT|nr:ABC transporter ATP-binding protein [Rhodovastum atsumiense]KAA5610807.1 ABC transporter ATP-binding protein [Rhodovastum atsumiense]CAH2602148.1 Spermidine/putrescine import ATP-binding protein PotA [Rhodovastum atsumiense]